MIKIRNWILVKIFPWLYPINVWSGKRPEDYDYSYMSIDPEEDGWMMAWFYQMNWEILKSCIKNRINPRTIMVEQYKEKYGSMRLYLNRNFDCIDSYEIISENTCYSCGRPDIHMLNVGGWLTPYCKNCFDKTRFSQGLEYKDFIDKEDDGRILDSYTVAQFGPKGRIQTTRSIKKCANKIRRRWNFKHPNDKVVLS